MAGIRRSAGAGAADATKGAEACAVEGRYANYFKITSTHFELIIDCGQFYAGCSAPVMHTRLITSPAYAQALIDGLAQELVQPGGGRKD